MPKALNQNHTKTLINRNMTWTTRTLTNSQELLIEDAVSEIFMLIYFTYKIFT